MKSIMPKKRSRRGFTLAETMLAMLIMLIATAIVVQGIPLAKRVHDKVVDTANAQSVLSTAATLLRDELSMAGRIRVGSQDAEGNFQAVENDGDQGTVVMYLSGNTGRTSRLYVDTDEKGVRSIYLEEYLLDSEGQPQATPRKLVFTVTEGADPQRAMELTFTDIAYNREEALFTIGALQVNRVGEAKALASIDPYIIRTVRP